jgi:hypothetical protein
MDANHRAMFSTRAMFSMGDCFWMTAAQRTRITNQYAGLDKVLNQTKILTRLQSVRAELAKLK